MVECNRRDFIRMTGCALGGVLLTGCGSGSSSPNGYRFYRLKTTGDVVNDGSRSMTIANFGGSVHISKGGVITFDAYDASNRHGLFQLDVDFFGYSPMILRQHTAIIADEILTDLRVVRDFSAHDVDGLGNIIAIIQPKASGKNGHYFGGLYYKQRNDNFAPLIIYGDDIDGGDTIASGHFGDVALCENNGIVVTASHLPKVPGSSTGRGLIHLPDPAGAINIHNRLLSIDDFINGTDHLIQGFGIVDIGKNGAFAASVNAAPSDLLGGDETASAHCILTGHLSTPNDHMLLAAPAQMTTSLHTGGISYGPRIGVDGTVFTQVGGYEGNNIEALIKGDEVIRRTDMAGPFGEYAASFTPGSTANDGTYYYTQYVENADDTVSIDLLMYDGTNHQPLLSVGDQIANVDQPIANIIFSTTTNHVDGDNRLVMLCQFADESTGLVVGVPV